MAGEIKEGNLDLSQLRNLVRLYIDNHMYKTAQFWADKVCTLSNGSAQDVLWLANSLFLTGQYLRAANLLKSKGLIVTNSLAKYLAAKCHYECKDWRTALEILDGENQDLKIDKSSMGQNIIGGGNSSAISNNDDNESSSIYCSISGGKSRRIESGIALLRGMIHEALENRSLAIQCFKNALQYDVYCFEAFDMLVAHNALTVSEEIQLLQSLPYSQQCTEEEAKLVKFAYECKISKYLKPVEIKLPSYLDSLHGNLDYIVCLAERHFNNYNYREAFKYTSMVLKVDSLHEACLPLHISCLVELKKKNNLYNTAHHLVNTYPNKSVSWYSIGAYYLLIKRNELARKYFSKATVLDNNFGPAWLGFAHSYACEGEHDQAISAYFSASMVMPGSHLPYLYLGLQYSLSNNIKLAGKFYKEGLAIAPDDPHIRHELGSLAYQNGEFVQAKDYFQEALKRLEAIGDVSIDLWEPLYNNLGHTLRKLKRYDEAMAYHEKALVLNPKNAGTCSAISLCYMWQGEFQNAIPVLHRALSLKRDDTIVIQLFHQALEYASAIEDEHTSDTLNSLVDQNASNSLVDLCCDSKSLSLTNLTGKSDIDCSVADMKDCSSMSLEMSDVSTPM